ncbi:MAG TPA: GntR family transcriptional regulator [Vicinamibacterales bacterium]|nr:GntR family transcriptional regulator [Vicinamibacterales bacterium]
MSKPSMSGGKVARIAREPALEPLSETLLGARAYRALWEDIVRGRIDFGAQLRPDAIAEQLDISVTPVREALHRMERDGLILKQPYRGWFVREFTEQEVRQLYEMRAALESFSVGRACDRITAEELAWLRDHQIVGEAALRAGNMEAYRIYNRDLHAAITDAARNTYLSSAMGQLTLQSQMLMAKTIRLVGRPSRAIEEHREVIDLIAARKKVEAQALIERHILSALEDILRFGISTPAAERAPD